VGRLVGLRQFIVILVVVFELGFINERGSSFYIITPPKKITEL
jgi:hypothetical protein